MSMSLANPTGIHAMTMAGKMRMEMISTGPQEAFDRSIKGKEMSGYGISPLPTRKSNQTKRQAVTTGFG
jgi:hypothetical protein